MRFVKINISAILDPSFRIARLIIVLCFSPQLLFFPANSLILQNSNPEPLPSLPSAPFYQRENQIPASGDSTIIIIEKVNDSIEINVARCSDGNIP